MAGQSDSDGRYYHYRYQDKLETIMKKALTKNKKTKIINLLIEHLRENNTDRCWNEVVKEYFLKEFDIPKLQEDDNFDLEDFERGFIKYGYSGDRINEFDGFYQRGLMTTNYSADAPLSEFEIDLNNFKVQISKQTKCINTGIYKDFIYLKFPDVPSYKREIQNTFPSELAKLMKVMDQNITNFKDNNWEDITKDARKTLKSREITLNTIKSVLTENITNPKIQWQLETSDDLEKVKLSIIAEKDKNKLYKFNLDDFKTKFKTILPIIKSLS